MRLHPIYLAGCFSMLLLFACTKQMKDDPTNPVNASSAVNASPAAVSKDGAMLHEFLRKEAPAFETYIINAEEGGQVTTKSGSRYTITGGSLLRPDGSIARGNVTISVKEIGTPAEMIFADRQTATSTGEPLVSYGEFFVRARQGGETLQLRPDNSIQVRIPARQTDLRQIPMWNGDTTTMATLSGYNYINRSVTLTAPVSANKGVDWDPVTNPGSAFALFDGTNGTFNFRLDSLMKWTNCDVLRNNPDPKTTVLCYFNTNYNPDTDRSFSGEEPTMLFYKPAGQSTIIKFSTPIFIPPAGFEGFMSYQNAVSIGSQGTFLAISCINGVFYAEQKTVTIAAPAPGLDYTTVTFNPAPVSAGALVSLITSMNTL